MQEKENALIQDMEANGLESEVIKERLRLAEQRGIVLNEEMMNNVQQGRGVPGGEGGGTRTRGAGMEKFTRSLSGYMMTASMVMGSLSMMGGEVGKVAQAITPLLGGFSMLTMLLQNMGKTMGFITLLAAAVAVAWLSMTKYNDTIASGIDKVLEFTDSIGAGAKAIQGLADFAGKVTASEIMDRRREGQLSPFTVVSGKSTFGESFVESETGQATTKALGSASAAMGGASQQSALFAQLSTAVLSNAITTKQARSIAISIGKKMGNVNLGIKVAGELASLMGPNGENILENGLEIRTRVIQQSQEQISTAATNLENSGMRNGDETGMMLGGIAAGAGVGAAAGAVAGSMVAGPIGAGIGAVIGTVAGGITGYFTASEEYGKRLGKLAGANVAIQAAALNQQKQLLDSLELDYEKRIKVAEAAGNAAKAERLQNEYITARQKLLNKTAETQQQISDSFAASDYQDQLLSGAEKVVTKKYKGTAQEDLATIAIENLRSSVTDKGQRYNLLLDLGTTIDPDSMLLLTSLVKNDADVMQKAFDIRTNLTGTGLAQVLQVSRMFVDENGKSNKKMQAEFVTKMSTVKGEKAEQLLQMYSELGRMNSNWIDATVLVDFVSKRPDVEKALMEDIEEIKNLKPKMLTVDIVQRASILNEQAMDVLRDNEKYFSTIKTKAEQQIYLSYVATFSGTMNFEDPNFLAWLSSPENKDGAKADIVGWGMYTDFVARRAVNDRILVDNTVGAGNQNNNGGGPSASWLDDYVKGVRDLTDASQKLTVGYSASQKALEAFAKKGSSFKNMFSGLTNNLFAANVSQDIIDNILGMPKEEAEKEMKRFFDSSGKATKFLKQLNEISARQKIEGQFVGGLQATKSIYDRVDATKALALGNQNAALTSELMADSDMVLALSGIKLIGNLKDQKKAVHELAKAKLANLAAERLSKGTVQNEIDDAQVRIDTLEAENGVYQNGLDIISKKAEKITEAYDKQIQALQEVKSVNDDIARQKQGELDIADALSRGDIGAAAKAAQQLRAQNAQAAADAQVKALEDAKKRAVDALTVEINGQKLSRADLEQKMYDIQLQVLEIRKDEIVQNEVILAKQREILNTLVAQTAEQIKKNAEASKPQTQTTTRIIRTVYSGGDAPPPNPNLATTATTTATGVSKEALSSGVKDIVRGQFSGRSGFTGAGTSEEVLDQTKKVLTAFGSKEKEMFSGGFNFSTDANKITNLQKLNTFQAEKEAFMKTKEYQDAASSGALDSLAEFRNNNLQTNLFDQRDILKMQEYGYQKLPSAIKSRIDWLIEAQKSYTSDKSTYNALRDQVDSAKKAVGAGGQPITTLLAEYKKASEKDKPNTSFGKMLSRKLLTEEKAQEFLNLWNKIKNMASLAFDYKKELASFGYHNQGDLAAFLDSNNVDIPRDIATRNREYIGYKSGVFNPDWVTKYAKGGMVMPKRFVEGGFAVGTDTIPAMLTPGEFVVSQPAVKSFGVDNLKSINSGTYGGDSVYNYSVNVNVANSGANANDIARTVMAQIKQIDSQRIRSNVL